MIRKQFLPSVDLMLVVITAIPVILPQPGFSPLLLAVPLAWLAARRWRGEALDITPLNPAVLLMALMTLVSLYATYSIEQSFAKIAGVVFSIGVFFTVAGNIRSRRAFYWMSAAFLLAGAGVAALGALGSRWLQKLPLLITVTKRLPSVSFGLHGAVEGFHPNEVAGVLLWVAPIALAVFALVLSRWNELKDQIGMARSVVLLIASILAALATWGVLILTQSRSGWLGAAAALIWTAAMILNRQLALLGKWRAVFWSVLSVFLVIATVSLASRILNEGTLPAFEESAGSALSINTLENRVEIWSRAIYGIEDFPFTGMGMNTFRQIVHVLYPLFTISPDMDIGHAHNHLLQAGLDLGIPGIIAYLSLWLISTVMLGRIWVCSHNWEDRLWVLGLGGGMLGYFVYGLTDAVSLGAKPGFLWWWLLGLIASLYRLSMGARVQGSVGAGERGRKSEGARERGRF